MMYGEKPFLFEHVENWGMNVPEDWEMGATSGVSIDSKGNIYLIKRTHPAIIVYDRDGHVIDSFGDTEHASAHGIYIDRNRNDTLWTVDVNGHAVYKWDKDLHRIVMTIGNKGYPSDTGSDNKSWKTTKHAAGPFNRPTNMRIAPNGDVWVADGYCNARVHIFSPDGKLKFSFGEVGNGPGEFRLVHGIEFHEKNGELLCYIADRQNHRIQYFDLNGKYRGEWSGFIRPAELVFRGNYAYIAECKQCGTYGVEPARVTICDDDGNIVARLGGTDDFNGEGGHRSSHGICIDDEGSIYVADTGKFPPKGYAGIKKYCRIK